MFIITLQGRILDELFDELGVTADDVHTLRVARDGDDVKVKVNEGMWTLGHPAAAEDLRRDANDRNRRA